MSIYETSITNPKKQLEFYKQLSEQLQQENQELKKQLEENQNPLKGIFAQVNDDTLLRDCGNMNAEINELKNQQKEFIEYMNKTIEELEYDDVDDEEMKGYLIQRIDTFKENIKEIARLELKNSFTDNLMETLNSAFIFKYVDTVEKQNQK